jgi:hypothetical protein
MHAHDSLASDRHRMSAEPAPRTSPSVANKRMDIELARILASIGIVLFHTLYGFNAFTYSGIVVFSFMTMWLTAQSPTLRLREKARRFLQPWAFWMVVYGLVNLLSHQPLFGLGTHPFTQLFAGTSVHLWYMPFALGCVFAFAACQRWIAPQALSMGAGALGIGMLLTHTLWREVSVQCLVPTGQWAHAMPAVLLGVAAAHPSLNSQTWSRHAPWIAAMVVAGLAIDDPWLGWAYVTGLPICWTLSTRPAWTQVLSRLDWRVLSSCTPGVYFSHILVFQILQRVVPPASAALTPWLTLVLSFVMVWAVRKALPRFNPVWS